MLQLERFKTPERVNGIARGRLIHIVGSIVLTVRLTTPSKGKGKNEPQGTNRYQ